MKDILIKYHLFIFPIKIRRSAPEHWRELTRRQFLAVVRLFSSEKNSEIDVLQNIYYINRFIINRLSGFEIFVMFNILDFLNQLSPCSRFLIPNINEYCSPKPRLEGMSFGQFMYADTYFMDYLDNQEPESLNKFMASLYLKANEEFSEKSIEATAKVMEKQGAIIKEAVLLNYRLIKEFLIEAHPVLFTRSKNAEEVVVKRKFSWLNVYDGLVGDDIINRDKYAAMPVQEVFRYLSKKLKKNAR
jgi:hypothetical protein